MIKGSCLCGRITYEYDGELDELAVCHCDQCKRAQGTPFATNAPIRADRFRFVSGQGHAKDFYSSPAKRRVFCSECGSPLFSARDDKRDTLRLRVGTVTSGHIPTPSYQIYCDSAAEWFTLDGDQPKYGEQKP